MERLKSTIKNAIIGTVLGLVAASVPFYWLQPTPDPEPYKDVRVIALYPALEKDRVVLEADFVKTGCKIKRLEVYGITIRGTGIEVEWYPIDKEVKDDDRLAGTQHLIIEWDNNPRYGFYEVRTRHLCMVEGEDGQLTPKLVDKLFVKIQTPDL